MLRRLSFADLKYTLPRKREKKLKYNQIRNLHEEVQIPDQRFKKKSVTKANKNFKIKIYRTIILPVVLYGCESWSLTLREERRLRVF